MGIQREQIGQNAYQGMRNTLAQLYNTYQAAVAAIMANPDLSDSQRPGGSG